MNKIRLAPLSLFLFIPIAFANSGVDNQDPEQRFIIDTPTSPLSTQESAEKYWTEERMRTAKPMPMPIVSTEELSRIEAEARFESSMRNNRKEKQQVLVIEPSPVEWEAEGKSDSFPIINANAVEGVPEEADVDQRPFWNAGRLYFTTSTGDYMCTAEFVGSNQILMTAAHCLMDDNGNWHTNIVFAPRYRGGKRFKNSGTGCKSVPSNYITKDGINHVADYGFITSNRSGPGWLGLKIRIPYTKWTAIGYPDNYKGGRHLMRVDGSKGSSYENDTVQMLNNPMGEGSSGGAWIAEVNTSNSVGGNYAIGLNSFSSPGDRNTTYGPYFNQYTFDIFNKVKKDCNIK
ncbi:hypothetical protein LPH44_12045 (plasmid) [Xylella taiwanensis]|uniref:Serine protease n=1 Tax=Xylella taiwanensis TaxID=1444770 RepID=A0ABS8TVU8_9GAMM|nr:hypothetical protein [Xylella taiwanensis]MCD8459797.1 hypothetical protein [Xylella taiwanensis]MCD8474187.1 hypothetical protein [Xylella taiwanensis]UFN08026.1 hypothetical protein LPH42_12065 [Xylella taiwanensis]UFN10319.1 hypothetical protein LPH45_12070 [Xylella taiwanensis]UFN12607.1 hypothetical protein LPH44_12045 [Xylella taiwanensis]